MSPSCFGLLIVFGWAAWVGVILVRIGRLYPYIIASDGVLHNDFKLK